MEDIKLIDGEGKRKDGRMPNMLRDIKIKAGVLQNADGSAYIEWGKNKIMVGVYGPREVFPKHLQRPDKAIVQVNYSMSSFSVEQRKKPGQGRRENEISKIISEALEKIIISNQFPRTSIDVFIEVLEASAGTRCAGLTAAAVALADAGIPIIDLVPSCAAGKINGQIVLDLDKIEDNIGEADLPVGYVPKTGEVVLLQMDGHLTPGEFEKAFGLAKEACLHIHKLQREALVARYPVEAGDENDGENADGNVDDNMGVSQ